RPNASSTSTGSNSEQSTSTVPSPPSAIGRTSARTPVRSRPRAIASAAADAARTLLRLAGHASARRLMAGGLLRRGPLRNLRGCGTGHLAEEGERQALASEEDQ